MQLIYWGDIILNITVFGAGALGVYFGGRLSEAGHQVTFLVREKRANQIKEKGLKVHSVHGDVELNNYSIARNTEEIQEVDLVLLSVKGYHLNGAIAQLKELVQKGAKILPVLNGYEHIPVLQKELGEENVLGGLSFIIATLDENGHVLQTSAQHKITFGPLVTAQIEFCQKLAASFSHASFETELSEDIKYALWNKYMFITAFSALTTVVDLPIGKIRPLPNTLKLAEDMMNEMKQLANVYGIPLTEQDVQKAMDLIHSFPDEGTSSMHQDKRKGLPLELDHMQGGALRLAEAIQLRLPTIELIYNILKPYENGQV